MEPVGLVKHVQVATIDNIEGVNPYQPGYIGYTLRGIKDCEFLQVEQFTSVSKLTSCV